MNLKPVAWMSCIALGAAMSGTAAAESGLYLGGAIGSAGLDETFDSFDIDDDVEAYRLLGGYRFGETFGIEAGYLSFGDFEQRFDLNGTTAITRLTADGWTLGGTLDFPLTEAVSLFGRGGVFLWDADVDVNGVRAALDDDSNPYYGAGEKVDLSRNFSLVGDWTRYELDDVDSDVISLGIEFRFGN